MEQADYLPLAMLNQLEYCERRFYLMHVMGEMEINAPVLEGTQLHERAHSSGAATQGGAVVHRKVYVWSDRLRIAGYADMVEESRQADKEADRQGTVELWPVEYKRGKMGKWLNDHVQLCAQAICLEESIERAARSSLAVGRSFRIEKGYLFYFGSRRREEVVFTPELRARTEAAVRRAFELIAAGGLPLPTDKRARCKDCSLQPVCLPFESDVWTGRLVPRQRGGGEASE